MTDLGARNRYTSVLGQLPVLAMLHLKGDSARERMERARRELDILAQEGVDGVVVEDYFGSPDDVERVLAWLSSTGTPVAYGVNVLDDGARSFDLADTYGAAFVQMDSVAGHLPPAEDPPFADWLAQRRATSTALLLGGVRFKYQPVLSGNSVDTDLELAVGRCDAVVVTGASTGEETDPGKTSQFRRLLGSGFPLLVGAGVTAANAALQLAEADGVIIGSSLKDTQQASGELSPALVATFMSTVRRIRAVGRASKYDG